MNALDAFQPGRLAGAAAPDAAASGAPGSSSKAAAQAWQREMERQQQSWFLPALPASQGVVWAVAPAAAPETALPGVDGTAAPLRRPADPPGGATAMQDDPGHQSFGTPAAVRQRSGHTTGEAVAAEQRLTEVSMSPHAALPPSRAPVVDESDSGPARSTLEHADLAKSLEVDETAELVREPGLGGETQWLRQQPAASPSATLSARLQDFFARTPGLRDVLVAPMFPPPMMRQGPVPANVTASSGFSPAAEGLTSDDAAAIEAEHAGSPRPPATAPPAAASPMRVHCDWQDGQLTVWIGHDRGHAEPAARLVQAIERWLATQRLSSASFVVNGEPVDGAGSTHRSGTTAASDEPSDHPLDGTPYQAFRRAFTQRENT